jgi:hypothetical protein
MEKFAISASSLKDSILFECILRGSQFATGFKYKDFYTFDGQPKTWKEDMVEDIHGSHLNLFKGEKFYTCRIWCDNMDESVVTHIFHNSRVYAFDSYYSDCPILAEILKEYK